MDFSAKTEQGFIKWVSGQPRDRVINHLSWHLCAVGDYLFDDNPQEDRQPQSWAGVAAWAEDELGSRWFVRIGLHQGLQNYGTLNDWMKSNPIIKKKGKKL